MLLAKANLLIGESVGVGGEANAESSTKTYNQVASEIFKNMSNYLKKQVSDDDPLWIMQHAYYGYFLSVSGENDDAISELKKGWAIYQSMPSIRKHMSLWQHLAHDLVFNLENCYENSENPELSKYYSKQSETLLSEMPQRGRLEGLLNAARISNRNGRAYERTNEIGFAQITYQKTLDITSLILRKDSTVNAAERARTIAYIGLANCAILGSKPDFESAKNYWQLAKNSDDGRYRVLIRISEYYTQTQLGDWKHLETLFDYVELNRNQMEVDFYYNAACACSIGIRALETASELPDRDVVQKRNNFSKMAYNYMNATFDRSSLIGKSGCIAQWTSGTDLFDRDFEPLRQFSRVEYDRFVEKLANSMADISR